MKKYNWLQSYQFFTLSAQTTPEKAPENNRIKRGYYYKN
jgi:hypothetical protein